MERLDDVSPDTTTGNDRILLHARQIENGGRCAPRTALALNDVALQKWETGRMIDFETWIDGRTSTPTAATAWSSQRRRARPPMRCPAAARSYNRHVDAVVLVPICPHTLSDRPLVVGVNRKFECGWYAAETRAQVACDGQWLGELMPGDELRIRRAEHGSR